MSSSVAVYHSSSALQSMSSSAPPLLHRVAAQSHSRLAVPPTRLSVMEHQVPQDLSVPSAEMDMEAAVPDMPVEALDMEAVVMETPMEAAMAVEATLSVPALAAITEGKDNWISQATQDLDQ